jgi:predicted RNA-binding Zn-ribbon protein involved in translation (DUF1610 family)
MQNMAFGSKKSESALKVVICTHCGGDSEVGRRAMSIFCPHCRKRLILEDYRIKGYKAVRELATCGDIVVERRGQLFATIIAENLTVRGEVRGNITARSRVAVGKTGRLTGDVDAHSISIEGGAVVSGFFRIGPNSR